MSNSMYIHVINAPLAAGRAGPSAGFKLALAIILALWLAGIVLLAREGSFASPAAALPYAIVAAIALPPLAFLLLLWRWPAFRAEILAIDPVFLTAVQGLRVLGGGFLFLYAFDVLPGIFAHPAGWGDLLVGLLAPFLAVRLARDPAFLASRWLWSFHLLGLLDFAGAIGSGLAAREAAAALSASGSSPLGDFPLALIPGFAVPLWICLHCAAFAQIGAARRARR